MAVATTTVWSIIVGASVVLIAVLVVVQLPVGYPFLILLSCHIFNPFCSPVPRRLYLTIIYAIWSNLVLMLMPFVLHQNWARSCDIVSCLALAALVHARFFWENIIMTGTIEAPDPMIELVAITTPSTGGKEEAGKEGRRWKLAWLVFGLVALSLTTMSVSKFVDCAFTVAGIDGSSTVSHGFTKSNPSGVLLCAVFVPFSNKPLKIRSN